LHRFDPCVGFLRAFVYFLLVTLVYKSLISHFYHFFFDFLID